MKKICIICGTEFKSPPSSKKITCSKKCSSVRKSISHIGKHNDWGDEARLAQSKKGFTPNLQKGTDVAKKSPKSGRFETNVNAKTWVLCSPNNVIYTIRNLNKFCRDNETLFNTPWRNSSSGIRAILRKKGRVPSSYKGWYLLGVYKNDPDNTDNQ